MKLLKITTFLFVLGGLHMFGAVNATTVQNEISVKASTGGNNAAHVQEGTSKGSVFIETIVDGEVVQHIDEETVSETGESVYVEKNIEYTDDKVQVEVQAQTHSEQSDTEEKIGEQHKELTNEEQVEDHKEKLSIETKPLVVSIVDFFRNLFSRFFA